MKLVKVLAYIAAIILFWFGITNDVYAQQGSLKDTISKEDKTETPTITATKAEADKIITLDGKLDESIWQQTPVATGFTQRTPHDGRPATEETEARVIYTGDAIYVGISAYDSAMDSVAATLFRKDGSAYSDWIYVNFDSYNDNRTSFSFAVNPRGVRMRSGRPKPISNRINGRLRSVSRCPSFVLMPINIRRIGESISSGA